VKYFGKIGYKSVNSNFLAKYLDFLGLTFKTSKLNKKPWAGHILCKGILDK
jgi:hypothetical protein